jgi:hypothetical protein
MQVICLYKVLILPEEYYWPLPFGSTSNLIESTSAQSSVEVAVGSERRYELAKVKAMKSIRRATQKFGEFDHKTFITVIPSFYRLLRSSLSVV